MLSVGSGASQCPEMTITAFGRAPRLASIPRRYAARPSHRCGYAGGGSMKKHGPPPCGMNNVGSLLAAFTVNSRQPQTIRAAPTRQLRGAAGLLLTTRHRAVRDQAIAFTLAPM